MRVEQDIRVSDDHKVAKVSQPKDLQSLGMSLIYEGDWSKEHMA